MYLEESEIANVRKIQDAVFWVMTSCSDVVGYHRFGEPCCVHFHLDLNLHRRRNLKFRT
jgi:hypothetical protein